MSKFNKGFTLIELLVVIAIIGILSGVVLTSLGTARSKGSDAAVKGDLDGVRASAQLYFDGAGGQSYGTASDCTTGVFADSKVSQAITSAGIAGGGSPLCSSNGSAYAVAVPLKTAGAGDWCVDSTGQAITSSSTTPVAGSVCN